MPLRASNIKLNNLHKIGIGLGAVLVGYAIFRGGKRLYEREKLKSEIRDYTKDENIIQVPATSSKWGDVIIEHSAYTINLKSRADAIKDSFYNNDWFGFTEDEDRAIDSIIDIPKQYIPRLAKIYAVTYQKDLYKDYRRFLDEDDFHRVKSKFD